MNKYNSHPLRHFDVFEKHNIFQSSVALELSEACSTDEEIKQGMYRAVERWWANQK